MHFKKLRKRKHQGTRTLILVSTEQLSKVKRALLTATDAKSGCDRFKDPLDNRQDDNLNQVESREKSQKLPSPRKPFSQRNEYSPVGRPRGKTFQEIFVAVPLRSEPQAHYLKRFGSSAERCPRLISNGLIPRLAGTPSPYSKTISMKLLSEDETFLDTASVDVSPSPDASLRIRQKGPLPVRVQAKTNDRKYFFREAVMSLTSETVVTRQRQSEVLPNAFKQF